MWVSLSITGMPARFRRWRREAAWACWPSRSTPLAFRWRTLARAPAAHIYIGAAAIADYRPAEAQEQKIKKVAERLSLELVKTPDVLAEVAALPEGPFTVGFAAETERLEEYAHGKLDDKKLDMIVANRVGEDCGFDRDENAVDVFWEGGEQSFAQAAKTELARDIIGLVVARYSDTRGADTQPELPKLHAID